VVNIRALNKHIIINRLSQLSLAILLLLFLGGLLWFSSQQSQQLRQQQEQAITQLLKQQLALAATMGLKLNEQQQLQWLAQSLNESPLLNGVWIHRADGTLMAESTEAAPTDSILLVSEIRQDKLLGYLKLSLNKHELIEPIAAIQDQQLKWHQWSLVLAGVIGFLLARASSQKRARYQLRNLVWRSQKKQAAAQQQLLQSSDPDNKN
jgi:membrane protein